MRKLVGIFLIASFLTLVSSTKGMPGCASSFVPACAVETVGIATIAVPDLVAAEPVAFLVNPSIVNKPIAFPRILRTPKPPTDGAPGTWLKSLDQFPHQLLTLHDA